jgi:hypothetical protein
LPSFLGERTSLTGLWGKSKRASVAFEKSCRKVIELDLEEKKRPPPSAPFVMPKKLFFKSNDIGLRVLTSDQ